MNKTKLSLMVLDDRTINAVTAVRDAIASISDTPNDVRFTSPWTIQIGMDREIEINLDRELMAKLSSLPRAKEFLLDKELTSQYDVILIDMQWENTGDAESQTAGLELIEEVAAANVRHPFLALYTQWPINSIWLLRALKANAKAVVQKQEKTHLLNLFVTAAETLSLRKVIETSRRSLESVDPRLHSEAPAMQKCVSDAASYAPNPRLHILITGPTGSGKELLAKAIHQASRAGRAFEFVDCASLTNPDLAKSELFGHEKGAFTGAASMSQGHFERASGGTVFLDEVHTLPQEIHAMLHRVIQDGEFRRLGGQQVLKTDVRVISATTKDPSSMITSGGFTPDFISRIAGCRIAVPGLNQRREDIAAIANRFLQSFRETMDRPDAALTVDALTALVEHDWDQGNVRELQWVIERSFTKCTKGSVSSDDIIFSYDEHVQQADQRLTQAAISRLLRARPRDSNQQRLFDRLVAQYPAFVTYRELHNELDLKEAASDKADSLLTTKMGQLRIRLKSFGFAIDNEERQGYHLRILEEHGQLLGDSVSFQ
jgi:DNA-binding NtrC family response regulator